jgi:thioredoxin-related protein
MTLPRISDVLNRIVAILALLAMIASPANTLHAALGTDTALPASEYELVVIEVEGCIYCDVFRRDVLPAYDASPRAKDAPIRFLDLNAPEAGKLVLNNGPVTVVPTVILVKANREIARVTGYMGPENFFRQVNWLLNTAQ